MLEFLPRKLKNSILDLGIERVNEIRIRKDCPVAVLIDGKTKILKEHVLTLNDIEEILLSICKRSLYSFDEHIKRGFVTYDGGFRIGLAGEVVKKNDEIVTIKNVSSLCVRIPSKVSGVSNEFFNNFYRGGSVMVIAQSGVGKTTFIRDLTEKISNGYKKSVVVVDERNEIASNGGGKNFYLGDYTDVLTYCDKDFGLNQAIRTLNPKTIITDEIMTESDVNSVISAVYSGVDVIATAHAKSINELYSRTALSKLKSNKIFDYFVLILEKNGKREYSYFNKEGEKLCF